MTAENIRRRVLIPATGSLRTEEAALANIRQIFQKVSSKNLCQAFSDGVQHHDTQGCKGSGVITADPKIVLRGRKSLSLQVPLVQD